MLPGFCIICENKKDNDLLVSVGRDYNSRYELGPYVVLYQHQAFKSLPFFYLVAEVPWRLLH